MVEPSSPIERAERVAELARALGIETVLIGAYALAAHHYVRGSSDIDLGTAVALRELQQLKLAVEGAGFHALLPTPDDVDPLGGVLVVWTHADEDGDPIEPVEVVNYLNPYLPRRTPAPEAIRHAIALPEKPALRYPRLADLVALKLDAGSRGDDADIVALLVHNADADFDGIRATAKAYGFERIDELIAEAQTMIRRARGALPRE